MCFFNPYDGEQEKTDEARKVRWDEHGNELALRDLMRAVLPAEMVKLDLKRD